MILIRRIKQQTEKTRTIIPLLFCRRIFKATDARSLCRFPNACIIAEEKSKITFNQREKISGLNRQFYFPVAAICMKGCSDPAAADFSLSAEAAATVFGFSASCAFACAAICIAVRFKPIRALFPPPKSAAR